MPGRAGRWASRATLDLQYCDKARARRWRNCFVRGTNAILIRASKA
jgi:hypothetical protein